MQLGEVYHISDQEHSANGHYFFIISHKSENGLFLAVNSTTDREGLALSPNSCIIEEGEYIGIKHRSIINLHKPRLFNDEIIEQLKSNGRHVELKPIPASSTLIQKIQKAFEISRDVPDMYRSYGFYFKQRS